LIKVAEEKKTKQEKPDKKDKKGGKDKKGNKGKQDVKAPDAAEQVEPGYVARLLLRYRDEILPALQKQFGYANVLQVPRIDMISINMGVGDGIKDAKLLDAAVEDLTIIAGQRPVITRAKKSVASFKLRKGMAVGCRVTLRGGRMYEFFDRLVNVAIPRIRDFRGLSPDSFDGHGNYTFGIREQIVFPEIDYDKIVKIRGMDVTVRTTASTDKEAFELLKALGMPFRSREQAR
jgi:large subunit ribosomal protein L5